MSSMEATFVIVGGGIAGVSCAETIAFYCPNEKIILITVSSLIKAVTNLVPLGKALTRFDVEERSVDSISKDFIVLIDRLVTINSTKKIITTEENRIISYKYLCLCTGARPKLIDKAEGNPLVIGIRDTESVIEFQKRIKNGSKIAIIGNGGIASEIVFELKNIAIEWIVKDNYISSTFVDPGAAQFFLNHLKQKETESTSGQVTPTKRMRYLESITSSTKKGAALGPDWHRLLDMSGNNRDLPKSVNIHYDCEIKNLEQINETLDIELTNETKINCDFLVSATGVVPGINFTTDIPLSYGPDNGIFVNEKMQTSLPDIFAAGDCCYAGWEHAKHWFQMRLWTQARQMGMMAGKSMAMIHRNEAENIYQDFCFEFFGHVTKLFGYQVVLLGKYNGQGLGNNYEVLVRITPKDEYIKLVLVDGRLQGAILIGETGLEETFENLLLNQLDLTPFGEDLLNPNIDIEDYFD